MCVMSDENCIGKKYWFNINAMDDYIDKKKNKETTKREERERSVDW